MISNFIAIDLGATSGRTIIGSLSEYGLEQKELTRFPNSIMKKDGHYYWDIYSIYAGILDGLKAAAKENVKISSIGIDTWGVDFVCVGKDGSFLEFPYSYRDPYTEGVPSRFFKEVMPADVLYESTGIQIMNFNTLFQIYAMKQEKSQILEFADRLLFIPDALSYLLTGKMVTEYTIASTGQILNPYTREINKPLLQKAGINPCLFGNIVKPGQTIGVLKDYIAEECGMEKGIPVIAVAGHDTASAIAAVPTEEAGFAYLSSGTWSLMGIETKNPVVNEMTYSSNITNEGGVFGTVRLLKNITGMWLIESCLREWKEAGTDYSYPEIVSMAGTEPYFKSLIDPDDISFSNPDSMTDAISEYCRKTSQDVPQSHKDFVCCIFESLALKYRYVLDMFRKLSERELKSLHIIGGGSKNSLLNQYTANAAGIKVIAGPSEATAIGNIMVQASAAGLCPSLCTMRELVRKSVNTVVYEPSHIEDWNMAYNGYLKIINTNK